MNRNLLLICTVLCIFFGNVISAPPKDLVVTSEAPLSQTTESSPEELKSGVPKIYEMKVDTNVTNRFATTLVTSKVKNQFKDAKETTFSMILPEKAFISGFIMEIGGKQYKAYVKEKEEAKQVYNEAVNRGQAAAHVSITARDSNRFTVSVNIEPESKAIFYLTYEELLSRQSDQYEIVMNIQPGQPIKDLACQVNIMESRPLKFVKTPNLRSGNEISKTDKPALDPNSAITMVDKNNAVVKFNPTISKQREYAKELKTDEENGLAGQFVVQYDVERDPQGGEVLVNEGYFVHFFAPSDIAPLPKYVVFILDTSGSMGGQRIQQLKEAMNSTLTELKPEDKFNVVEFSYGAKVWDVAGKKVGYEVETDTNWYYTEAPVAKKEKIPLNPSYDATEANVKNAIKLVNEFEADGGTNIMAALKTGIELVQKNEVKGVQPMIVFLTDGEATMGETNNELIISEITKLNDKKTPLISLSFGDGADRVFLEQISLNNSGFARHIYESADASLQLEDFYKTISNPLLSNIKFKYVSNVTDLTTTDFPLLFSGSEIIVAGKKETAEVPFVEPNVLARGKSGEITLKPVVKPVVSSLEKHWAYLTLRQILEQRDAAKDKSGPTQAALPIALKYSFVSDITSLVVVKPNDSSTVETEDASKAAPEALYGNRFYSTPIYAPMAPIAGGAVPYSSVAAYMPGSHSLGSASFGGGFKAHKPLRGYARCCQGNTPTARLPPLQFHLSPTPVVNYMPNVPVMQTVDGEPPQEESLDLLSTYTTNIPSYMTLLSRFDWMKGILSDLGILTTPLGPLDLGTQNGVSQSSECKVNNSTGNCKLLNDCIDMDDKLTDLTKFQEYSCKVETYTGVCCLKPIILG